jgi:Protein of unknown function (DUF2959)
MITQSAFDAGVRELRKCLHWLPSAAVAAVLLGCASAGTAPKKPTARQDFEEYRRIVVQAMSEVDGTMRALDELCVEADQHPRAAYQSFARAVHRLEVDSVEVRARAQAIRARGDAYFEHWEESVAGMKNEQVRKLAEEHSSQLKQTFAEARQAAQEVRETFRPFLTDLQKLRAVLEAEPSLARIDSQKSLILATKDQGRQVQQGLDRVLAELNSFAALLTPPGTAPKL